MLCIQTEETQGTAEMLVTDALSVGLGWEGNPSLVSQESAWKDAVILWMPDILPGQISPVHFQQ